MLRGGGGGMSIYMRIVLKNVCVKTVVDGDDEGGCGDSRPLYTEFVHVYGEHFGREC
jgi:hypothetical protein